MPEDEDYSFLPVTRDHLFVPGKKHPQWCAHMSTGTPVGSEKTGWVTVSSGCGYRKESHSTELKETSNA